MSEIQLEIQNGNQKKSLLYVTADDCIISRFNTRKTRDEDDITNLAQRIERNGFEITRALWAYKKDGRYEVFAGGNRLEAVRETSHKGNVPLLLYEGFTDEQIAQLEMQDNENDEYHVKVSVVDVWSEYARLRDEEGWTQEQIARAKGITQKTVSLRLRLHDKTQDKIKGFIRQDKLTERHLEQISNLYVGVYLSPWLTTEQLWLDIAKKARTLTTRETKEEVDRWKEVIQIAEDYYNMLSDKGIEREYRQDDDGKETCVEISYNPKDDFVNRLAEKQPNTIRKVQNIIRQIEQGNLDSAKEHEAFLRRQVDQAEAERQRQEEEEHKRQEREFFYPKIFCQSSENMDGELIDIDDAIHVIPDESVHLVITSPPYNMSKKYDEHDDKMPWDDYRELLLKVFSQCYKKLVNGGRIAVNIPNVSCEPGEKSVFLIIDIWEILQACGFSERELITWVKTNKGFSDDDLERSSIALATNSTAWGSWCSPSNPCIRSQTEHIWVFQKRQSNLDGEEEPDLTEDEFKLWTCDVWFFPTNSSFIHPAVFPEKLPKRLIKLYSYPKQIILDPFMGIGTTGIAALKNQRRFIGFDISAQYCREAIKEITSLDLFDNNEDHLLEQ